MHYTLNTNRLVLLLVVSITIFLASLYNRVITFDDAYFAEQAYWINKVGYARTELFNGILDWGTRQYTYHKLHVWQIAIALRYFGWSPYIIKSIPVIYLSIFSAASYFYFKHILSPKDTRPYYIFLSLFLMNAYIVQFGFEARPEIMIMCVAFLSFYSIRHGLNTNKDIYIYLSGSLAGIATLFHLNGIIFIFSGMCILLYMKRYKYVVIFLISSLAVSSIYFYEIIRNDAITTWLSQLTNDPAVHTDEPSAKNALLKIILSPKRYVRHLYDFSYTLFFILTVYFNRHNIKNNLEIKILLIYFFSAEILLAVISPGAKSMYIVLHMPYALITISYFINNYTTKKINAIMLLTLSIYIITQAGHSVKYLNNGNSDIIQTHALIFNKYNIKNTHNIIAPSLFVFNEIDNANIMSCELFRVLENRNEISFTQNDIFNYALKHNIRIMIFNRDYLPEFINAEYNINNIYFHYKLIGIDPDYYIFEKIS